MDHDMRNGISIIGKRCATLEEIREQVSKIVEKFNPLKVVLFGSYAEGTPTPESDVDLLVILETNRAAIELISEISLALDHSFPVDIIVKTPQQVEKRIQNGDFFLEKILQTGKVLYERDSSRMDQQG